MTERAELVEAFLADSPWRNWSRTALAGDASARRYLRLTDQEQTVILMDAAPQNGEDTKPFAQIASLLHAKSLCAPDILAHDPVAGLMVLSDLGEDDFARWLADQPADAPKLYRAATDVLIRLQEIEPPEDLTWMTPAVGADMIGIIGTHYAKGPTQDLCAEMERALTRLAPAPTTLALRDYHAENLIWRADRSGTDRVGLLDFQDAFIAPAGYDLASLLRDARRDVPQSIVDDCIAYYATRTNVDTDFPAAVACLGVQRNLRIMGVFARLATEQGKTRYLRFMPRVWSHIVQDLENPALADLRQAVRDTIPAPTHIEEAAT